MKSINLSMRGVIIAIIGLALLCVVGTCVYFVAGVSATSPPIKEYEFSGNVDQFLNGIKLYASANPHVKLRITDTTGNIENGYAIYFDVEIKGKTSDILYNLKCEKNTGADNATKTLIELIGAFNAKDYKIGGYSIKGTGVKMMVKDFDTMFLPKLLKQQNMSITSH